MITTIYNLGGYDPTKPNNNIKEVIDDGLPDPIDENTLTIPPSALDELANAMNDSSVNSIAEVKQSILSFVDKIKQT